MSKISYFLLITVLVIFGGVVVFAEEEADTTAPAAIEDLAVSDVTSVSVTLAWTAPGDDGSATGTAAALYDIRYATSTISGDNWDDATQAADEPAPEDQGEEQLMVVGGLNAFTTYYFAMKTQDEVPNTSDLSNVVSTTTPVEVDETAPVISAVAVSDITENSAVITWTTDEEADSQVEYGTTVDYGSETTLDTSLVTLHSVNLSGLNASTTYHFQVKSKDALENEAVSEDYNFITSATVVVPADLEPTIKVNPRVFNLKSKGSWVSVTVVFPEGYNAKDIDMDSVKLNEVLSPDSRFKGLGFLKKGNEDDEDEDEDEDEEGDGDEDSDHSRLILKFSRQGVFELVPADATEFEVTVSGNVGDKTFSGSNTVKVLNRAQFNEGEVVKVNGDNKVFIIINGKKRHIPSPEAFERLGLKWRNITEVVEEFLDSVEEDILVRVAGKPSVYMVIGDKLYHVPSPVVFLSYGFDWDDISTITLEEFKGYKKANLIKRVDDPKVYLLRNGKKHWIPSPGIFKKHAFKWTDIITVNATDLDEHPEGEDMD